MLARHSLISCMLSLWKLCTMGLTCNGSLFMVHGIFSCMLASCFFLSDFSFIILPDYNKDWNKKFSFSFLFFYLFPHICGFLVNQLLQLYQELVKDFTQFCCWPAHGLHMQWTSVESICLEKKLAYWTLTGHYQGPVRD